MAGFAALAVWPEIRAALATMPDRFWLAEHISLESTSVFQLRIKGFNRVAMPRLAALAPLVVGLIVVLLCAREFTADLHAARGQRAFAARQMSVAMAELTTATDQMIWPFHSDLYLGLVWTAYHRSDRAFTLLTASLEHHPTYEAMLALAELETARGNFTQADRIFAKMLTKYPDDIRTLLAHGYLFVQSGHIESARQRYRQALGIIENRLRYHPNPAEAMRLAEMKRAASGALDSIE